MNKRMEPLEVDVTDDGQIRIAQVDIGDPQCILISPDQVDVLKQWLDEAKEEVHEAKGMQA